MTLPEFSVRQTVFVNVLFFVCMIGGWNALQLTEVEYFHDVVLNQVVVTTQWTGASADEVERLVTAKLEEELITIGDVEEMRSYFGTGCDAGSRGEALAVPAPSGTRPDMEVALRPAKHPRWGRALGV